MGLIDLVEGAVVTPGLDESSWMDIVDVVGVVLAVAVFSGDRNGFGAEI